MLKLLIQQHRPPRTRFTVKVNGLWAAFNSFEEVTAFLHDLTLDETTEYCDLTEDDLSYEIDAEYLRLTNNLRAS